jgi:hypothetical protein
MHQVRVANPHRMSRDIVEHHALKAHKLKPHEILPDHFEVMKADVKFRAAGLDVSQKRVSL